MPADRAIKDKGAVASLVVVDADSAYKPYLKSPLGKVS